MLYGSLRQRSYSKLMTEEAAKVLRHFGAEVKIFNPAGLPLVDEAEDGHEKVVEFRKLSLWSQAHVWCSPERHGAMTGVMKTKLFGCRLRPSAVYGLLRGAPWHGCKFAGAQSFNIVCIFIF